MRSKHAPANKYIWRFPKRRLEGKEEVGGYAFVFINFARAIVPLRIAFALALAPWCDKNIIQKYFPAKEKTEAEQAKEEDCEVLP